jgi:transcriptional regulator with XRE-family HTH domain
MVGDILSNLMRERKITQVQLFREIGIGQSTLSDILANRKTPGAKILKKLSEYLDVSVDYLIGVEKSPNSIESGLSPIDAEIMKHVVRATPEMKKIVLEALRKK